MDEKAALKLLFATMMRAADRCCRLSISHLEHHQPTLLRAELGLDPPPGGADERKTDAGASPQDQQATDYRTLRT